MEALTSPGGTSKDDRILGHTLQPLLDHLQAISFDPKDLGSHTVDFCIVFTARKHIRILLNGKDALPAA